MGLSPAALREPLAALLAARLGDPGLTLSTPVRLSGGASRDTFSVDVIGGDGTTLPCVVRCERGRPPGRAQLGLAGEAALLGQAARAGVPVPAVVAGGEAGAGLGAPFLVMERVEGETLGPRILRDERYRRARERLVEDCAAAAARIHTIPVARAGCLRAQSPLEEYRAVLDANGEPHPAFELAFRWLVAHRPPPGPTVVVHGDLRLGNLVIGEDGLRAVLDWELAHLGDAAEDLGWLCVRAWRFGGRGEVAGVGAAADLLDAYRRHGGEQVEPARLRWWEVMGTLRWGIICLTQAATHRSGVHRSVELAAIGRRACQVEWDLLGLLDTAGAR